MEEIIKKELMSCIHILKMAYEENNPTMGEVLDTAAFEMEIMGEDIQFHVRLVSKRKDFLPKHGVFASLILGENVSINEN